MWEIFETMLDAARPALWSNLDPSPSAMGLNLTRNLKIWLLRATDRWIHLDMILEFSVLTLRGSSAFVQTSFKPNMYGQYFGWYEASNFETKIFQKLLFAFKWEHNPLLRPYQNWKISLVAFLWKVRKSPILASFVSFLKQISRMKVYFKKMAL